MISSKQPELFSHIPQSPGDSFTFVHKRDGRLVAFDSQRIADAIARAGEATGEFDGETAQRLALRVLTLGTKVFFGETPSVEKIQNLVEEVLLDSPFRKTAKAYILYRDQHARMREISTRVNVDLLDQYLQKSDWKVKENSNMTFSLQGLNNYISSGLSQTYWLNAIYPGEIKQAHESGDLHLHDLNQLSVYCVGWDLYDLLRDGFRGVPGKIETKPAKHFRTALGHVITEWNSPVPMVGASGAISGILGAYLVLFPFARVRTLIFLGFLITYVRIPAAVLLGLWFLIQIGSSSLFGGGGGGVAWFAHIGGFIAGAVLILPFRQKLIRACGWKSPRFEY